jgi:hypothetical protein
VVLNWSWLASAGLATVLLALLPCAAMHALCMNRGGKGSCKKEAAPQADASRTAGA